MYIDHKIMRDPRLLARLHALRGQPLGIAPSYVGQLLTREPMAAEGAGDERETRRRARRRLQLVDVR